MARPRKRYWVNSKKGVVVGRFYELVPGNLTRNPPMVELCSYEEARFYEEDSNRKERTEEEFQTFLDAKYAKKLKQIREDGGHGQSGLPIQAALDLWLREIEVSRSPRTLVDYRLSASLYHKAVGFHYLHNFQPHFGALLMAYLVARGLSQRTVYKHISNIQSFFSWAEKNRLLKERVYLTKPRKIQKEPRIYTVAQLQAVLSELQMSIDRADTEYRKMLRVNQLRAFIMAVYTAMRGGEIWSLKLKNIRLDERMILIRDVPEIGFFVKGRREAKLSIASELAAHLIQDFALRGPKEVWYLDDGEGNQPYVSEAKLARPFTALNRKLGIGDVKPLHGIRASVITHLLDQNQEITKVQGLARHTLITTTKAYQNTQGQNYRDLVESIKLLENNFK